MTIPNTSLIRQENIHFLVYSVIVSFLMHASLYVIWPDFRQLPRALMVATGELVAAQPPEPALLPLVPPPKQELRRDAPITTIRTEPQSRTNDAPQPVKASGVALPVLTDQSSDSTKTDASYSVADTPPLQTGDVLPFASAPGSLSIQDYIPAGQPDAGNHDSSSPEIEDDLVEDGILSEFADTLRERASQFGKYPETALKRRWQGVVKVQLRFNADGSARQIAVMETSGHRVLDERAIEMVKQAVAVIALPANLEGRRFSIVVPIKFRLQ